MANSLPCGQCANFDGAAMLRAGKPTQMGWCTVRSKYPAQDKPGRDAPRGVKRVGAGELPQPVVKTRRQIEVACTHARAAAAQKPRLENIISRIFVLNLN